MKRNEVMLQYNYFCIQCPPRISCYVKWQFHPLSQHFERHSTALKSPHSTVFVCAWVRSKKFKLGHLCQEHRPSDGVNPTTMWLPCIRETSCSNPERKPITFINSSCWLLWVHLRVNYRRYLTPKKFYGYIKWSRIGHPSWVFQCSTSHLSENTEEKRE
jgi:hypothetical protein